MKAIEREEKFTKFKQLYLEQKLSSQEIIHRMGISATTVYKWRKKLHTTLSPSQNQEKGTLNIPSFTKLCPPSSQNYNPAYIEFTIEAGFQSRYQATYHSIISNKSLRLFTNRDNLL